MKSKTAKSKTEKMVKTYGRSVVRSFRIKETNYKALQEIAKRDGGNLIYYGGITFHMNRAIEQYIKKNLKK